MRKIKVINGEFKVPEEFALSESKRRLHIKMPWQSRLERWPKDSHQVSTQYWFRRKPQKPYVPEGHVQIDGEMFKVEEIKMNEEFVSDKVEKERDEMEEIKHGKKKIKT